MGLFDLFKKKQPENTPLSATPASQPSSAATPSKPAMEAGVGPVTERTEPKKVKEETILQESATSNETIQANPATASPQTNTTEATHQAETPNKGYIGDLDKTNALFHLVAVPPENRDEKWEADFIANLAGASLKCGDPQVIKGPDGFPYVQLLLPTPNEEFQSFVIEKMKDDFLLENGLGVVINPQNGRPDWVLTYGDIVNLHLNKTFYTLESAFSHNRRDETIQQNEEIYVGQPSEELLPKYARNVLKNYLQQNGLTAPKVLLMMRHGANKEEGMMQDLTFNATPEDFTNEEHYRGVMQSLGWFLPRHYSYVGMKESSFEKGFLDL